jgi:hypothetical protein
VIIFAFLHIRAQLCSHLPQIQVIRLTGSYSGIEFIVGVLARGGALVRISIYECLEGSWCAGSKEVGDFEGTHGFASNEQ